MPTPIVDSHIHLFPASHLPTLAWHGPNNPLGSQHSIDEYRHATSSVPTNPSAQKYLRGFIFLETDRISSIAEEDSEGTGWKHALDEVSLLTRIALGEPVPGEGHKPIDQGLCLGIVPWAPVPGGADVLQKYMDQVKERTKTVDVWRKVCGVRYLVQDKAAGVMLEAKFVDALRWLGTRNLTFDLGVDARSGGLHQLREAVEMMGMVYRGLDESEQVTIVISELWHPGLFALRTDCIDHLCKPNLRLDPESVFTHTEFLEWKELITCMAKASNKTYMKLSGAFSELPPLSADADADIDSLVERLQPWTDVVFDAFGAERVMFGSDWPVCTIGGGGNDVSWKRWRDVVAGILGKRGLKDEEKESIWGRVAIKAYRTVI